MTPKGCRALNPLGIRALRMRMTHAQNHHYLHLGWDCIQGLGEHSTVQSLGVDIVRWISSFVNPERVIAFVTRTWDDSDSLLLVSHIGVISNRIMKTYRIPKDPFLVNMFGHDSIIYATIAAPTPTIMVLVKKPHIAIISINPFVIHMSKSDVTSVEIVGNHVLILCNYSQLVMATVESSTSISVHDSFPPMPTISHTMHPISPSYAIIDGIMTQLLLDINRCTITRLLSVLESARGFKDSYVNKPMLMGLFAQKRSVPNAILQICMVLISIMNMWRWRCIQ
jgi:hypothetical protein